MAALLAVALTGCDGLLDVENPNNIKQEDLETPKAAAAAANAAYGTVTRGVLGIWGPYSTATDEVIWIGSRDAWNQLDRGFVSDRLNEFTDDAFKYVAEGRWMADEAIRLLEGFDAEGDLLDRKLLARAYLSGAIMYITIADQFDDFAFSDKKQAAPAVGPDKMNTLYEKALGYIASGRAIAQATGDAGLATTFTALEARARHAAGVWKLLNPASSSASPLVGDAQARSAALAVIGALSDPDWKYQLTPGNRSVAIAGEVSLAYNVNERAEMQLGSAFFQLSENKKQIQGVKVQDPIDKVPDPVLADALAAFKAGGALAPYTVVSAREMHLIAAEADLAAGNTAGFQMHINHVRAMDGLTPYTGQIPAVQMLEHARRVNLYLQGRRLADLYRFGMKAPEWQAESDAARSAGTFFPITIIECRANTNLGC